MKKPRTPRNPGTLSRPEVNLHQALIISPNKDAKVNFNDCLSVRQLIQLGPRCSHLVRNVGGRRPPSFSRDSEQGSGRQELHHHETSFGSTLVGSIGAKHFALTRCLTTRGPNMQNNMVPTWLLEVGSGRKRRVLHCAPRGRW